MNDAAKVIVEKLRELDAKNDLPNIMCPAEELMSLPTLKFESNVEANDKSENNDRFNKIENSITELKGIIQNLASSGRPGAIPQATRDRLISDRGAKRSRSDDNGDYMVTDEEGDVFQPYQNRGRGFLRKENQAKDNSENRLDFAGATTVAGYST